jgi:hypothetical protein
MKLRAKITRGMDRNYYRTWQADRRAANKALGLTWDGRPRCRKIRFDLAHLGRNARHVVTNRERRSRLMSETSASILISKLDVLAASIQRHFDKLPAKVQTEMLQLAHEISAVRKEVLPDLIAAIKAYK